jgi:hypothetical protein
MHEDGLSTKESLLLLAGLKQPGLHRFEGRVKLYFLAFEDACNE